MLKEWIKENLTEIEIWIFIVMWIFGMISAIIDTIWEIRKNDTPNCGAIMVESQESEEK